MNAVKEFGTIAGGDGTSTLGVSETYWGYIVRERRGEVDRLALRDMALIFGGAVLIVVALGQWFLPGALISLEILPIKIALTAVMMAVGLFCFHAVKPETSVEVQVDTTLRELRVTERDRRGATHLIQRIPMREIDSAYVKRGPTLAAGGHLLLRLASSEDPLHFASGSERELRLLHDRLRNDLRPARERVERRLLRQAASAMPTGQTRQSLSA